MRAFTLTFLLSLATSLLIPLGTLAADDPPEIESLIVAEVLVTEVLVTDIIPMFLPAFHDAERAGVTWDDLLAEMPAMPGNTWPRKGGTFPGREGDITWHQVSARGGLKLKTPSGAGARYFAFYLTSDRWQKISIKVTGDHTMAGIMGTAALDFTKNEGDEDSPTSHTAETTVVIGTHLIVLRSLRDDEATEDWTFSFAVTPSTDAITELGVKPDHHLDIETVLNAPRIGSVSLSSDGELCAISLSEYRNGDDRESWIEIRDTSTKQLVRLWRGSHAPSGLQ